MVTGPALHFGRLPDGKEIVLLRGTEDRLRGLHSTWSSGRNGEYTFAVIGADGDFRRKLYYASLIDVRHATPDLSPDGRHVCLTDVKGAAKETVLAATDGSGAVVITSSGPHAFASWKPAR